MKTKTKLILSQAPHIKTDLTATKIMWLVVISLLPSTFFSIYLFGLNTFWLLTVSVVVAILAEAFIQKALKKTITIRDGSAVITGLLVAMNVPPEAPIWLVAIGSGFAIIIAKQLFGGLGYNIFNPALAARAFMVASWPVEMTTKWHSFSEGNYLTNAKQFLPKISPQVFDAITKATPLTILKGGPELYNITLNQLYDYLLSSKMLMFLFLGNVGGTIGETSALLLLLGGMFLIFKKVITWHIPFSFIGSVVLFTLLYYFIKGDSSAPVLTFFHLFSGGLFLGAFFMATDMVTSPISAKGMILFGIGCGFITFVIRIWGGYPEGVSYSILLMNAVVPLIDRFFRPKIFGTIKKDKNKK